LSSRLLASLGCVLLSFFAGGALASSLTIGVRTTSGTIEGVGAASNSDSDTDSGSGFERTESLAKVEELADPNPYTWFASALVSGEANLEVGVDLNGGGGDPANGIPPRRARPACCVVGSSDAIATVEGTLTNPHDHEVTTPRWGVLLPPGEVLFRLPTTLQPIAGQDSGFIEAAIFLEGFANPVFRYRLELVTTDGGFMEDPSSTPNVPIDLIFDGAGGVWGYKTAEADIDFDLPAFGPHETKAFRYVMTAHGENHFQHGEVGAGFSVRLGDPFDATFGGGLAPVSEFVPEPRLAPLLVAAGLSALARRRSRIAANAACDTSFAAQLDLGCRSGLDH
jgi:hypothetical protein